MERTFQESWDALKGHSPEARKELEQAEMRSDVGKMLLIRRVNLQMERKALAKKCGVSARKIAKIEFAEYNARLSDIIAIAQALGLRLTVTD